MALTDVLILEQQAQAQQFESIDCSTTTAALAKQLHPGHRWDKQATTQARQLGQASGSSKVLSVRLCSVGKRRCWQLAWLLKHVHLMPQHCPGTAIMGNAAGYLAGSCFQSTQVLPGTSAHECHHAALLQGAVEL